MSLLLMVVQATEEMDPAHVPGFLRWLDSPLPYSPFSEYILVLLILWFVARKQRPNVDFSEQAQEVLEEKFKKGEIDKKTYEKYRQELSMRLKKE
jgi:hypothetical protein